MAGEFGIRHSRWRTWIRVHTPTFLYDLGLVVPKARDCGNHEWHRKDAGFDACYHSTAERPHDATAG
jgi:hypothetical protein